MDETRTINLILWIMLLAGMVFLGLFYFITSHQPQREPETSSIEIDQLVSADPSETISISSSSVSARAENPALSDDHNDTAATDTNEDIDPESPPSLKDRANPQTSSLPESPATTPTSDASDQNTGDLTVSQTLKEVPEPLLSLKTPQHLIRETSKNNGTFFSAQKITSGLVSGEKSSEKDRADFYKVQSAGNMMTLKLETSIKKTSHGLNITVFNSDTKFIGRHINKSGDAFAVPVTPQALYYIRVNLSKVSMKNPEYKINVSFN